MTHETFRVADQGLRRILDRMAAYLHGAVPSELALIGIRRRGVPEVAGLERREGEGARRGPSAYMSPSEAAR